MIFKSFSHQVGGQKNKNRLEEKQLNKRTKNHEKEIA